MKTPSSTDKPYCMVCGIESGNSSPISKRKSRICSKACYDQLQKVVTVYGETLQRKKDEVKEKQEEK